MKSSPSIDLGASPSIFSSGASIRNAKVLEAGSTWKASAPGVRGMGSASSAEAVGASCFSAGSSLLHASNEHDTTSAPISSIRFRITFSSKAALAA
jgi:hypothetical protein